MNKLQRLVSRATKGYLWVSRKGFRVGKLSEHGGFQVYWGSLVGPKEQRKYHAYVKLTANQFEYRLFNKTRYVGAYLRRNVVDVTGIPDDELSTEPPVEKFKILLAV